MEGRRLSASRAFVCCSNIVFLMSGLVLMSLGVLLLIDSDRVLLSRLIGPGDAHPDQPLFYYLAFAIVGVGFFIAITGILGCWASCLFNCCITVTYMLLIVVLLVGECTFCVMVVFTPHLLGVDVRSGRLVRALQRSYAVPGREQFTAALDLAQTMFSCCGITGSSNYGTSWWRLQEVGRRDLVVPYTCCTLNNTMRNDAFLNPEPVNLGICQTLDPTKHEQARHTAGCSEMIEKWTQEQALILLAVGLAIVVIEVSALLSTFLACSKISSKKQSQALNLNSTQTRAQFNETDQDYGPGIENRMRTTGTTFGGKS